MPDEILLSEADVAEVVELDKLGAAAPLLVLEKTLGLYKRLVMIARPLVEAIPKLQQRKAQLLTDIETLAAREQTARDEYNRESAALAQRIAEAKNAWESDKAKVRDEFEAVKAEREAALADVNRKIGVELKRLEHLTKAAATGAP